MSIVLRVYTYTTIALTEATAGFTRCINLIIALAYLQLTTATVKPSYLLSLWFATEVNNVFITNRFYRKLNCVCVSVVLVAKLFLGKNTFNPPLSFNKDRPPVEQDRCRVTCTHASTTTHNTKVLLVNYTI